MQAFLTTGVLQSQAVAGKRLAGDDAADVGRDILGHGVEWLVGQELHRASAAQGDEA